MSDHAISITAKDLSVLADKIAASSGLSKSAVLNHISGTILGPKHDWGAISNAKTPVVSQRAQRIAKHQQSVKRELPSKIRLTDPESPSLFYDFNVNLSEASLRLNHPDGTEVNVEMNDGRLKTWLYRPHAIADWPMGLQTDPLGNYWISNGDDYLAIVRSSDEEDVAYSSEINQVLGKNIPQVSIGTSKTTIPLSVIDPELFAEHFGVPYQEIDGSTLKEKLFIPFTDEENIGCRLSCISVAHDKDQGGNPQLQCTLEVDIIDPRAMLFEVIYAGRQPTTGLDSDWVPKDISQMIFEAYFALNGTPSPDDIGLAY